MTQPGRTRILLAEADEAIASSLAKVLATAGYEVSAAAEGIAAARHLAAGRFDLLLVDLDTFSDDSSAFCQALHARADAVCPILLLSGSATRALGEDAGMVGALLNKPTDAPVLLERIACLLKDGAHGGRRSGACSAAVLGRHLGPQSRASGSGSMSIWRPFRPANTRPQADETWNPNHKTPSPRNA